MEIEREDGKPNEVIGFHGFIKWAFGIGGGLVTAALIGMVSGMWVISMQMAEDRGKSQASFDSINQQLSLLRIEFAKTDGNQYSNKQGSALEERVDQLEEYHRGPRN